MEILEENIEKAFQDIISGNDLLNEPKSTGNTKKDKSGYIKMRSFCTIQNTAQMGKIFANTLYIKTI
jgi:hypothetical protein